MVILRGLEFIRFHYARPLPIRSRALAEQPPAEGSREVVKTEAEHEAHRGDHGPKHPQLDLEAILRDIVASSPESDGTMAVRDAFGQAVEAAQQKLLSRIVEGGTARIREAVHESIDSFLARETVDGQTAAKVAELASQFDEALANAAGAYTDGTSSDFRGTVKGIKEAFKELEHALRSVFEEPDGGDSVTQVKFDAESIKIQASSGEVDITAVSLEVTASRDAGEEGDRLDSEVFLHDLKHAFKKSFKKMQKDLKAARKILRLVHRVMEHDFEEAHHGHGIHGKHHDHELRGEHGREWQMLQSFLGILKKELARLYQDQQEDQIDTATKTFDKKINLVA